VHHAVYAVGHLPTSPIDKAHGALLAAGSRSGLAGFTALALWRAERTWPEPFELISPCDIRVSTLVVHRSKTLLRHDIRTVQGLRVTSPARAALDLASRLSMEELTRVVNDLRLINKLRVHQLRDVVARNDRHPGAARIKALIGDSQREPTRSELANAFQRLIKRYKLPTPLINVHVGGERVDAYFPDNQLIVELDGRLTHGDDWKAAFEEDRRRMVDVMLRTGIPTIRFTHDRTSRRHRETAAKVKGILDARAQRPLEADPLPRASRGAPRA
jgi:very-short-patch-repair endonuclease